jgi:hypothetical protein
MANTFGISGVAKQAAMSAILDAKALKAALYLVSGTTGPTNATYTATGELAATGNYVAGGATVTNANTAGLTTTTAYWSPSASIVYPANMTSSAAFDMVMIYSTTDANRNIGCYNLGSQTITAGLLTLTMPTNDASTGVVRFA